MSGTWKVIRIRISHSDWINWQIGYCLAEYSNKIISLSEEVLGAKREFETRMKSFQSLQEKFEREKEQALEKLRAEHQKEIQVLEQRFSESQLLNLEQK